ncbi:MAG: hypothetical protein JSR81_02620 [Proteobacteria bacterium]|nr:hypothetical protein [Pseudomonadota bacterium]
MRLGDNNFYNLFSRLVTASNPDRDCDEWNVEGVVWRRSRHIHWAPLSFQIETHRLAHAARPRWSLVFVHETWWGENRGKAIRNAHWTHLEAGDRRDVLRWFSARQAELDQD